MHRFRTYRIKPTRAANSAPHKMPSASTPSISKNDVARVVGSVSGRCNACLSRCAGRDETTVLVDWLRGSVDQSDDPADRGDEHHHGQNERLDGKRNVGAVAH